MNVHKSKRNSSITLQYSSTLYYNDESESLLLLVLLKFVP